MPGFSIRHGCSGHDHTLTFRIPRDHYGNLHPRILAILRNQEDEWNVLPERCIRKVLRRNGLCKKWGQDYRSFRRRVEDPTCKAYFTYLNYGQGFSR